MILAACGLAGLGGLLLQLTLVRRHGLLLGNTAEAATLVLGLFLLGLGLGGLLGPRLLLLRRRPLGGAAVAYAMVALAAVAADAILARPSPVTTASAASRRPPIHRTGERSTSALSTRRCESRG